MVAFLGHLGTWDLAGAWGTTHLGPVTTVAVRLKPEEVFEEFLAFRESLGMTIIPLTGGVNPFPALREAARRPGIIPLLADRDLTAKGVEVVLYEPALEEDRFYNSEVVSDLEEFKWRSDVIVANRRSDALDDVADKVYTRDLFGRD